MTCRHCVDAGDFFGSRLARHELKRYRRRGPSQTTRLLLAAILDALDGSAEGLHGSQHAPDGSAEAPPAARERETTLLDIGGGVGALQHGLVRAGAPSVTAVDASTAYLGAAGEEARRMGEAHRYNFVAGDAVELAPALPEARVVTLDRVLCCYPDMPALVEVSTGRTRELWGVVYPREWWGVRLGVAAINLFQRARGKAFRVYLHGPERIRSEAESRGLEPVYSATTLVWRVELYARRHGRNNGAGGEAMEATGARSPVPPGNGP